MNSSIPAFKLDATFLRFSPKENSRLKKLKTHHYYADCFHTVKLKRNNLFLGTGITSSFSVPCDTGAAGDAAPQLLVGWDEQQDGAECDLLTC